MSKSFLTIAMALMAAASHAQGQEGGFTTLFDGRTLRGWEGDESVFRVVDGTIVGGTLEHDIAQRDYLCTTQTFDDFELRVSARIEGGQNAGVHFRSHRVANSNEVGGYQADMGFIPGSIVRLLSDFDDVDADRDYPLWGSLLDEFRSTPGRYPVEGSPYWLLAVADRGVVNSAFREGDWNEVSVRAVGPKIEIGLNGVPTVEFVEQEDLVQDGLICLQLHNGPPSMVRYRDIRIRRIERR